VLITDCLTEARWLDGAPMARGRGESHFPNHPQELAERYYHVTSWAEHPTGGHFPAVAEPELLARRLRDAFRPMRHQA
jgi:hypothetical protein